MTLPKNITDAIDVLLQRACKTLTSAYSMPADEYLRICTEQARAALEAAIADHIADAGKKVEPPTDAEVEAWAEASSSQVDQQAQRAHGCKSEANNASCRLVPWVQTGWRQAMTGRLTDDEIKALHQFCTAQLPKRTPWVCLDASKMLRLLDEIEDHRRFRKALGPLVIDEPCPPIDPETLAKLDAQLPQVGAKLKRFTADRINVDDPFGGEEKPDLFYTAERVSEQQDLKQDQWLVDQAKMRGLTPAQLAERFFLETEDYLDNDKAGPVRFVRRLRLIKRNGGVV